MARTRTKVSKRDRIAAKLRPVRADVMSAQLRALGMPRTRHRRPPSIHRNGVKVLAPITKTDRGDWSKTHYLIAQFLDPSEAVEYARKKVAQGIPAYVKSVAMES